MKNCTEIGGHKTVNIFETNWYRNIKSKIIPGDNLRIYRQNHNMTQAELGQKIGQYTPSAHFQYGTRHPDNQFKKRPQISRHLRRLSREIHL